MSGTRPGSVFLDEFATSACGARWNMDCEFYFVADVDNFIRPCTLRELVALNLPIVAPLLRSIDPRGFYSNYHAEIDASGYYKECDQYQWILNRWIRGVAGGAGCSLHLSYPCRRAE